MTTGLLDLVDLEFAFSQQALLTPDEFIKQAARRGHRHLTIGHLEAYHRTGSLVPIFRARKLPWPSHHPQGRMSLSWMHSHRLLIDPRSEAFHPWSQYYKRGLHWDWSSRWVYSPYQLLSLSSLGKGLTLGSARPAAWGLFHFPWAHPSGRSELVEPRLIFALTSLERRYLPNLTGRLPLPPDPAYPGHPDGQVYLDWMRAWDAPAELARLDYGAPGILKQAERLLIDAGWFDPLENWLPVIRHATFQACDSFTHEARLAIDFRVAAELLLMCYEDLVKARVAEPIPKIPLRAPHPLHNRLNGDRQTLDADLTDFGLSPHPLIVLVLEGKTEMFLIPAALKAAGFDISHSTIQIINGEGAGRDLSPLIAPLIAPEVTEFASDSEFLMVKRPATRLAIATDSEKLYTDTQREPTRRKYVKAIAEVMKQTQGAKVPDDQLDGLVSVYTWGSLCLEFACFTDRQLASAITRLKGVGRPPVTHLEVKQARNGPDPNAALARLLKRDWTVKKPDLAQALVPVVERQIARAMKRNSFGTSPIASLLLHIQKEAREIRAERTILKGSL